MAIGDPDDGPRSRNRTVRLDGKSSTGEPTVLTTLPTAPSAGLLARPARTNRKVGQETKATGNTTTTTDLLEFYPSYCYSASPTYFTWVKLTAYEVHHVLIPLEIALNAPSRWKARQSQIRHQNSSQALSQNLFFYLNHPVQFVYLVGVVVATEDFFERRWVFTIDDGSGATIEVVCPKVRDGQPQQGKYGPAMDHEAAAEAKVKKEEDGEEEEIQEGRERLQMGIIGDDNGCQSSKRRPSMPSQDGKQDEEDERKRSSLIASLEPGTVVQVKGTIHFFHRRSQNQNQNQKHNNHHLPDRHSFNQPIRQISLLRLSPLSTSTSTSIETSFHCRRLHFHHTTLSHPWHLTDEEQYHLLQQAQQQDEAQISYTRKMKKREEAKKSREERHARRIVRAYEREEVMRREGAEKARKDGQRLMREFGWERRGGRRERMSKPIR